MNEGSHEAMEPPDTDRMSGMTFRDGVCKNVVQPEEPETSSALSCVSFKSNRSMSSPLLFRSGPGSSGSCVVQKETSAHSCVSFKSDGSMNPPLQFRSGPGSSGSCVVQQGEPETPSPLSCVSSSSMKPPEQFRSEPGSSGHWTDDRPETRPAAPKIKQCDLSAEEEISQSAHDSQTWTSSTERFRASLRERFQRLSYGLHGQAQPTLLNDIYTELYITEGGTGDVNNEHEVRQIEMSTKLHQYEDEKIIKCNDIFKGLPGQDHIRTVLTKGVAGVGKTVSVQKFILDWADGKANQDIEFILPLPFRELNLMKDRFFSLEGLVRCFFPQLKDLTFGAMAERRVVFIFDGLDECRLSLDFQNATLVRDVTSTASVDVLLVNLIRKNLLPSALIWMTTRPAASGQIPAERIDQLTEIRGFTDPQKEEYFTKKIPDQSMADKIIKHLKLSRSLYIMCHIPVFCWISATVLEKMFRDAEDASVPKTLTQMYTHFLGIQTSVREKYPQSPHGDEEMVSKLGRLAFKQLLKGNLIFYEEDLRECGIDVMEAVTYSGVCTQIFREEFELLHGQGKVFCFVHLSIQEHLAALYVHLSFSEGNTSVLDQWNPTKRDLKPQSSSMADLYTRAVDKALQSHNGQFDMFLRFLLGLSQEASQVLLHFLLPHKSEHSSRSVEETIEYIKFHLRRNLPPEKYINLFHCLNELNDFSLEEDIQNCQRSRRLSKTKLSTSQWGALVFVLLTSGSELNVFDPWKYTTDDVDECLHRMLPVLMASRAAEVSLSKLSAQGFQALSKSISSSSTCVRELKLSGTPQHLPGIRILSEGLRSSHCKLEILRLSECSVTTGDSGLLVSALDCNPSHLRELDLSFCTWNDSGMLTLRDFLKNSLCRLEKLKLVSCELKKESCTVMAAALSANSSLTELDLSKNNIGDYGLKMLCAGLKNVSCKLKSFSLADCGITERGCDSLCTALKSNPSYITELCLNRNKLGDRGARVVSHFLKQPFCKLERLRLSYCGITEGASELVSALGRNPSHLRELELVGNRLDTSVRNKLSDLQQHRSYRLEKLML